MWDSLKIALLQWGLKDLSGNHILVVFAQGRVRQNVAVWDTATGLFYCSTNHEYMGCTMFKANVFINHKQL